MSHIFLQTGKTGDEEEHPSSTEESSKRTYLAVLHESKDMTGHVWQETVNCQTACAA